MNSCLGRNRNQGGFSLVEILVVLVIMGLLISVVAPTVLNRADEARVQKVHADFKAIETALKIYRLDNFVYPTTEQGLQALVDGEDGFFVTTVGDYLWNVIPMSFQTFSAEGGAAWQGGWTIFYWGWWISWAPFVGMFIARISRGRTIREFMLGVMFVPTTIAFFWLCIFGGSAMYLELNADGGVGTAGIAQLIRDWNLPAALFGTIEPHPSPLETVMLATFPCESITLMCVVPRIASARCAASSR